MKPLSDQAYSKSANDGVLSYIAKLAKSDGMVHPDLNEHIGKLRKKTQGLAHRKYLCCEVLVGVDSQLIQVVAFGTAYAIKVGEHIQDALTKGESQKIKWSDGTYLDILLVLGSDWIAGSFNEEEAHWISIK